MRTIISKTRGIEVLVDDEDYDLCAPYNWSIDRYGHVISWQLRQKTGFVFIHRWIMKPDKALVIDHIDGNKLDNRRSNLRICTKQQNLCNGDAKKGKRKCKYKGCYLLKNGRYRSQIKTFGKWVYLGEHDTEEQAALAYNIAAVKHHGEFAKLNNLEAVC